MMKHSYLEVTYRKGRPLAAYYYLPRQDGDRSVRTELKDGGFVVDYSLDDRAIGIEITCPERLVLSELNQVLKCLGHGPVTHDDMEPLVAA